ncbi:MAG: bifunctional 2-polyprenyl-6-hydroxyphenol methylase/3-demethylubiquinol 3-O-methyltransferase UbiG [Pseudomonadota bacterium]
MKSDRPATPSAGHSSVDPKELERFAAIADEWWDPDGKFKPLHQLNPTRLTFIRRHICQRFSRDFRASRALEGLTVLDIGCGGGLLSEPLARQGGAVTGIDPSETTIGVARSHASASGVEVNYRATQAEDLVAADQTFDVVLAMEVVEHVTDVPSFVSTCASLVAPGGLFIASTINRTLKAYALAIVGAERVMRWLPVGTHRYDRFVRPGELEHAVTDAGLVMEESAGMIFDPLSASWRLSERDLDVNYLIAARSLSESAS